MGILSRTQDIHDGSIVLEVEVIPGVPASRNYLSPGQRPVEDSCVILSWSMGAGLRFVRARSLQLREGGWPETPGQRPGQPADRRSAPHSQRARQTFDTAGPNLMLGPWASSTYRWAIAAMISRSAPAFWPVWAPNAPGSGSAPAAPSSPTPTSRPGMAKPRRRLWRKPGSPPH